MKLNIYKKKKVVKTYTVNEYDLMWGTIEDIIQAVDLDKLENINEDAIVELVGRLLVTSFDTVRELILDIFEDMTEEELKQTKVVEIARVLIDVVIYTVVKIEGSFNAEKKTVEQT